MIGENDCPEDDHVPILPQMDNATLCGSAEYSCYHFDVTAGMPHTAVLRKIAWVNWGLAFISTFCGVIYIYTRWIKEKNKIAGWPWDKKIYGISLTHFKCMPRHLVGFGLICKLIPSLTMDVLDILTDTLYFNELTQSCGILDTRLHTPPFVFHTLFAFMLLGMVKNLGVTKIAFQQLTKRLSIDDTSESDLIDSNAYMALTFFQGILAFVFQDAAAALIQFFYIDKYVTDSSTTAIVNGVIMLVFSLRVLYVFSMYVWRYGEKSDPTKVKIFHVVMGSTKFFVCLFHAMRTYAVVFSKMISTGAELDDSCFSFDAHHGTGRMTQQPFVWACLTRLDKALLASTGLASIGAIACTIILAIIGFEHFKIFSQSHYSGRVGNITGPANRSPSLNPELQKIVQQQLKNRATELR